jgi:Cof subfamily protein (haloacid dehalogenase superfamily)
MTKKGWIALDIDGTITLDKYSVPEAVTAFLRQLNQEGWSLALATGRPYAFASMALNAFDFPYTVLAQNGSVGIDLPAKNILFKKYISPGAIPLLEEAYEGINSDFLIYAGYEKGDFCYWRPRRFSPEDLHYLDDLQKRQQEKWEAREDFKTITDPFPLIKCFGSRHTMQKVADRLAATEKFQVTLLRDPFVEGYCLLLVTDRSASKGASLNALCQLKGRGARVIAAGDDENDISLLQAADIKIAMAHAPETVQRVADLIAPPTQQNGIIQALQMALKQ